MAVVVQVVDLMSRHGTYVGRKKLPPHDPFLLHGEPMDCVYSIQHYPQ